MVDSESSRRVTGFRRGLLVAGLALVPAAAQQSYEPLLPVPVVDIGLFPYGMELVDLDGDGALDVLSTSGAGSAVVVASGNGAGGFGPVTTLPTPAYALRADAGDLDGDGALDLACHASEADVVVVFKGLGAGAYGATTSFASDGKGRVELADLDGDGHLDALNAATSGVTWLPGDGSGGFLAPVLAAAGTVVDAIELGDVDLDGHLDVVGASQAGASSTVHVLLGDGQGGLVAAASHPSAYQTLDVELADLDGNGLLDVLTLGLDAAPRLLLAAAPGVLVPAPMPFLATCSGDFAANYQVRAHDLDGDGDLDLAAVSGFCAGVQVFEGDGQGAFAPPRSYEVGTPNCVALAIGDIDADGDADLAVAAHGMTLAVLVADGTGGFAAGESSALPNLGTAIASADVDADGAPDVVGLQFGDAFSGLPAALLVARGLPEGGLAPPVLSFSPLPGIMALALGDLDGDGDADVALTDGVSLVAALGDGDGSFAAQPAVPTATGADDLATADLDEDGSHDVALNLRFSDAVQVWLADGAGGWSGGAIHGVGDRPEALTAADLDADGHADLAVACRDGAVVSLLLGDGHGQLVPTTPLPTGPSPTGVEAADVDDDGDLDLLVLHDLAFTPTSLGLLRGDGSGGFGALETLLADAGPLRAVRAGDLHGDGITDIVLAGNQVVTVLAGTGSGSFAPAGRFGCRIAWDLALLDVDRDGALDAVTLGNALTVLRNRTVTPWQATPGGLAGAGGVPLLTGQGDLLPGTPMSLALTGAAPATAAWLVAGAAVAGLPFKGGVLVPTPDLLLGGLVTDAAGGVTLLADWPAGVPSGLLLLLQAWLPDAGAPQGFSATNGLAATVP